MLVDYLLEKRRNKMMKRRTFVKGLSSGLALLLFCPEVYANQSTPLVIGTTAGGTWGYAAVNAAAAVFKDAGHTLIVQSRPDTARTWYDVERRRFHIAYGSSGMIWQAWNARGPFKDGDLKEPAFQTLTIADSNPFIIVPYESSIEDWEDLRGKRLYPIQTGFGNYETLKASLKAADLWEDIEEVQMKYWEAPEALARGDMDACGSYIMGGVLPSWDREIDRMMKIRVIPPREEHVKKMEERLEDLLPGTFVYSISLEGTWEQDVGLKSVVVPGFTFGLHAGQHVEADCIYQFISQFFSLKEELFKAFPGFRTFLERGEELNLLRARAISQIPVHPGMVKYLKEKDLWDESLVEGETPTPRF